MIEAFRQGIYNSKRANNVKKRTDFPRFKGFELWSERHRSAHHSSVSIALTCRIFASKQHALALTTTEMQDLRQSPALLAGQRSYNTHFLEEFLACRDFEVTK